MIHIAKKNPIFKTVYYLAPFAFILFLLLPWLQKLLQGGKIQLFKGEDFFLAYKSGLLIHGAGCVLSNIDPTFPICIYDPEYDTVVSKSVVEIGSFELPIGMLLKRLLQQYPNAVLVDVGANIGMHSLLGATMGHEVWSIDPITENLAQIYKAAKMSGVTKNMKLFRNGVDAIHGLKYIKMFHENVGGSFLQDDEQGKEYETIKTVLLNDIIQYAKKRIQ